MLNRFCKNKKRMTITLTLLLGFALQFEFSKYVPSFTTNVAAQESPFTDFHGEQPGKVHRIVAADLPQPYATSSVANFPRLLERPRNAWPQVPSGFKVDLYTKQLANPRMIRTAPNGDFFVADSSADRVLVFRGITSDGKPEKAETFAADLNAPFGIAFYPPGPNPHFIYIGNTDSVIRFPYENGDLKARGQREVLIKGLPTGGHWTRDVAFSLDGKRMFVAVGSRSNVTDTDKDSREFHRANILTANPDGTDLRVYASGIRNPVSLAVDSRTGVLWTSVNERDLIGDNLPPDYITHVQENGFYGWPWYYIGGTRTRG